jgi:branched-chain amino acid aminotransferase
MAPKFSWMNGRLVPWDQSTLHVKTEAVLRGASVFEGIRAYRTARDDLLLFRVGDHLNRLVHTSMRFLRMPSHYEPAALTRAMCDLIDANNVRSDAHIRVVVYFDELRLGHETESDTGAFIVVN